MTRAIYFSIVILLSSFIMQACAVNVTFGAGDPPKEPYSEMDDNISAGFDKDNTTWIIHPKGINCEVTYFNNLDDAKAYLSSNNIFVLYSKSLTYYNQDNSICGQVSNVYFGAIIKNEDLNKARQLGWKTPNQGIATPYNLY